MDVKPSILLNAIEEEIEKKTSIWSMYPLSILFNIYI